MRINPRKKSSVSPSLRKKLFNAIEEVLKEGIKRGGASELAFVTPDGGEGNYQDFTLVYGREGEPCRLCKTTIKKIKLGGRGTYFCPACQS
jgi:formamidopyrimidine-DNA glycosylase